MVLLPLECAAQNYAWGKQGLDSSVARLALEQGAEIDAEKMYAELWMGTHPNGPSKVALPNGDTQLLSEWCKENPDQVSADPAQQEECAAKGLPYLFKILSVRTALSIQAHPDKALAERLHAARPDVYKDPNHKPEMACAITPFEALAGFLPLAEVVAHINSTPELKELLETSAEAKALLGKPLEAGAGEAEEKAMLKVLFAALMTSEPAAVESCVAALESRLRGEASGAMPGALALRLCEQYPGDVGVFCVYFMCYRVLEPGQAVFLGANEPHAYLAGDCAEIMACSDNVVRAGLTPKLRDVDTLVSMLTYRQPSHTGAEFHPGNLLAGHKAGAFSEVYSPPDPAVTEFQMERVVLAAADGEQALAAPSFACVLLVLDGEGTAQTSAGATPLSRGKIFLQPCGAKLSVAASTSLTLFRASLKGAF